MKKTLVSIIILATLQSCGSVGNKSMMGQSEATVKIVRGETTYRK
jgi:uncharacterized protein YceK